MSGYNIYIYIYDIYDCTEGNQKVDGVQTTFQGDRHYKRFARQDANQAAASRFYRGPVRHGFLEERHARLHCTLCVSVQFHCQPAFTAVTS